MSQEGNSDTQFEKDIGISESAVLARLQLPDLPAEALERLAKNASTLKSRKIKIALVCHPHTPRHVSVPLARQLYTFELVKVALSPTVLPDIKVAIDDILISRLKSITIGERLTLARRATARVAAALLVDVEAGEGKTSTTIADGGSEEIGRRRKRNAQPPLYLRVMRTALENKRLTEALVISTVLRPQAGASLVNVVARHAKWSKRSAVRAALLRSEHLSLASAIEFSREIPSPQLNELMASSQMPERIKNHLIRDRSARKARED
jgi:hypothetical protein